MNSNTNMNELESMRQVQLSEDMVIDSLMPTGNAAIDNVIELFNKEVSENKEIAGDFLTAFVKHNAIPIYEVYKTHAHSRTNGLHPVEWMYIVSAVILFCQANEVGVQQETLEHMLIQANRRHFYRKEIFSAFENIIPEEILKSVNLKEDFSQWN